MSAKKHVQTFGLATIASEGGPTPAVLTDAGVRPVDSLATGRAAPEALRSMLGEWDQWCEAIGSALASADGGAWIPAEAVDFLPPITDPPAIYCAGANYRDHVLEMGVEDPAEGMASPFHFLLPPAALVGHGHKLRQPPGFDKLDWEIELAVLIGSRAKDVDASDALDYVAGYTVANDLSVRNRELIVHPWFGVRWIEAKGQETMQPLGPAIVPARFVADPMSLDLELSVNGEVKQKANTGGMMFSVVEQIVHLSRLTPLMPGDLILTGTPAGTAGADGRFLATGDEISATIERLGTLENSIGAKDDGGPAEDQGDSRRST